MRKPNFKPAPNEQAILEALKVHLLTADLLPRAQELLGEHHYLGSVRPVGERLFCVAEALGQWRALFCWNAAAKHLRHRDNWIGWSPEQRHVVSLSGVASRVILCAACSPSSPARIFVELPVDTGTWPPSRAD